MRMKIEDSNTQDELSEPIKQRRNDMRPFDDFYTIYIKEIR